MEDIKITIRSFLTPHFPNYKLKDDDNIFSLGFINSLFAMQLVLFTEREFHITVENEDLDIENFKSVDALAQFVTHKLAAKTHG